MAHPSSDGGVPPRQARNFMAELGERLIDNGYSVLPIIPSAKSPGRWQESRGWVGLSGWERFCDRAPKSFELDIWQRWPGCGIGIPCGFIHGVDIDVLDERAATAIERLARSELGDTPCLRIGLAPKRLLVYRSAASFPSIKKHPIEVLGHGAQFVGYGIHGETGNPYFWPHEGLDEVHIGRLPEITEEQCRRFLDLAYEMVPPELRQRKLGPDRSADYYYAGGELRGTRAAVASALQFLPNDDLDYDSWIYIGLAIKGALGEDGGDIFAGWSSQSIKDQPPYTTKTWCGLKPERLGAGTIYYYAGQNGWVPEHDMVLNGALEAARSSGAGQELIAALSTALPPHDPETGEIIEESPEANPNSHADSFSLPVIIGEQYRDLPRREMVIKGLLGVGELSVTYGAPKTGKSFLLTSCALAIACGDEEWFGHRVKRTGLVIYCIMEGAGGFPNRLAAWSRKAGRKVPDTFVYVPVRLRFLREEGARTPLQRRRQAAEDIVRLQRLVAEIEAKVGQSCTLLVVDTVARAMTGRDENSTQDMGEFVDACAELQTLPSRPHVALVHHESKTGSMRGSSALLGAGDTMIRVQKDDDGRRWAIEFSKDDADGREHVFDLEMVALYADEDGDEVTSCVVLDEGDAVEKKSAPKPLTNKDKALAALADVIASDGIEPPPGTSIPVKYVVSSDYWRLKAMPVMGGDTQASRAAAFRLAKRTLSEDGLIATYDNFVWLADAGAQSAAQMIRKARG